MGNPIGKNQAIISAGELLPDGYGDQEIPRLVSCLLLQHPVPFAGIGHAKEGIGFDGYRIGSTYSPYLFTILPGDPCRDQAVYGRYNPEFPDYCNEAGGMTPNFMLRSI